MAVNIARAVVIGNLTRDPELRHTQTGTAVCKFAVAVNRRDKVGGEWEDAVSYFDIVVWGNQGESCAQYLAKGRPVGVDGRLQIRQWTTQEGDKRYATEIIADSVQFLGGREEGSGGGGGRSSSGQGHIEDAMNADDDIPF